MMQHVLRVKSPSDRAREAYFEGKMSIDEYLRHALKVGARSEAESPRTQIQGMRHSVLQAVR